MPALPDPFVINIAQDTLDDLNRRLRDTRWALDLDNDNDYYGISTRELKDLADYWADGFDWRAAERRLNQFTHHRLDVGGVPVHFIRRPGSGPAPIPIILSHGWPGPSGTTARSSSRWPTRPPTGATRRTPSTSSSRPWKASGSPRRPAAT